MRKKIERNAEHKVGLAVLGASLAGLAAGAYFFFGPNGKKHQRHTKAWAIKMKGDVVAKLEAARVITESLYHRIIDSVASKYGQTTKVGRDEVKAFAVDLKKHWKMLRIGMRTAKRQPTEMG